jgi:hypothetical protein
MRRRISPPRVLLATLAMLWSSAAAHASDERRSARVGSVEHFRGAIVPDSTASAVLAAPPKPDPLGNGIAIGAAIGAATGLGLMAWAYNQCEGSCDAPEPAPMYLMVGGFGAAVGGVVGWIVDAHRKNTNRRVAVGGVVEPKRSHLRVTVSW